MTNTTLSVPLVDLQVIQETCYMSAVTSGPDEHMNQIILMKHGTINLQMIKKKWREAIRKELYCMENKKVWRTNVKQMCQKTED